jgi:hypothetical protein
LRRVIWGRIIRAKNAPAKNFPPPENLFSSEEFSGELLSGRRILRRGIIQAKNSPAKNHLPKNFPSEEISASWEFFFEQRIFREPFWGLEIKLNTQKFSI